MNLTLRRINQSERGTFGVLLNGDIKLCVTCEDPWNDNERNISCIPQGTYKCVPHDGAKYSNVWRLLDVPDRDAILIHAGNTINDTQGCILVGTDFIRDPTLRIMGISQSVKALNKLRMMLPEKFSITIEDVP